MTEVWVAAATVVVGAASGYAKSKKEQEAAKQAAKDGKIATKEQAEFERQNAAYDYALQDYYKQKDRVGAKRGLDEFRKFSTVQNFAPDYVNTNPGPVLPTTPDWKTPEEEGNKDSGGGKKKSSIVKKLVDPLGVF